MFKSGFQPVCVLYQGNKSPFDGSCQLVCRHQILKEDFKQGDLVKVVEPIKSGSSSNGVDGQEVRKAIVMGEEMMTTLMGTLFKTKQNEVPSSTCGKKRKIEEEEPETETQKNATPARQEMILLQHIFLNVKQLKEEFCRQALELSHIKQRQVQIMNILDSAIHIEEDQPNEAVNQTLSVKEEVEEVEEVWVEEVPGPIIASVRSTSSSSAGRGTDDTSKKITQEGSSQPLFEPADEGEEVEFVYSSIDIPGNEQHSEDDTDDEKIENIDNRKSYLEEYVKNGNRGGNVEIGNLNMKVLMPQAELEDILSKTTNPTGFAYRLTGKCFTSREMIEGNTRGGGQRTDGAYFKQLNPDVVEMITGEIKKRFPTTANEVMLGRTVRNAINERARNERKRLNRLNLPPYNNFLNRMFISPSPQGKNH